jgi:methyl-accepting chemotaxis protein
MTQVISHVHTPWMRNVSTMAKLIANGMVTIIILLIVSGVSIWGYSQFHNAIQDITTDNMPSTISLLNTKAAMLQFARDYRQAIFESDAASVKSALDTVDQDAQLIRNSFASYLPLASTPEEQQNISAFQSALQNYFDTWSQIKPFVAANTTEGDLQAIAMLDKMRPFSTSVSASLQKLIDINQGFSKRSTDDVNANYGRLTWTLIILSAVAILLSFGMSLYVSRLISAPLLRLVGITQQVAEGDLSPIDEVIAQYGGRDEPGQLVMACQRMISSQKEMVQVAQQVADGDITSIHEMVRPYEDHPEKGILLKSLHQMIERLREMIERIQQTSDSLAEASGQIASAANQTGSAVQQVSQTIQQVAIGVQQQSSQLVSLNTEVESLHQIGDTVAETAHESGRIAGESAAIITSTLAGMQQVGSTVGEASQQVQQLAEQSKDISAITISIADIADQTNLLALNAAIEAARAGDHGRGFAVVADEVRKLAERTAQETKHIAKIINDVQLHMEGTLKTMDAGESIVNELREKANTASQAVQQILVAMQHAEQLSQSVAQSAQNASLEVSNVVSISEENSASAEEVASAAEEMSAQVEETMATTQQLSSMSQELLSIVEQFQLERAQPAKHQGKLDQALLRRVA